jgi:anti-anti-sigma factor
MAQAPRQYFEVKTMNGVTIVRFLNTPTVIVPEEIREVGAQLSDVLEEQGHAKLLINLSDISWLPSAMLGGLIALSKKLARLNGGLRLCCIAPGLMNIFRVTKVERLFANYGTEQAALDSF